VTALREYLQNAAHDDALTQEIAAAYYDEEITFEQLKALVGAEEAANLRVLKQQLDEDFVDGSPTHRCRGLSQTPPPS